MRTAAVDSVRRNATSIAVIQGANIVLPLLLIPYLTRVFGIELYGVVAFGLALVQMVAVITDFGFSVSAPHVIATQREDSMAVRRFIGAVFGAKFLLVWAAVVSYVVIVLLNHQFRAYAEFFWLLGISVVLLAFQPTWFFQGMEQMRFITYYTIAARVLYVGSALLVIRERDDLVWLGAFYSMSFVLSTGMGVALMVKLGFAPVWPGWRESIRVLRESMPFFWSRAAVMLYTAGSTVFVGAFGTLTQVGYYGLANQVYRAAGSLQSAAVMAYYPYMARTKDYQRLFQTARRAVLLFFALWLLGLGLAPILIPFVFGADLEGAVPVTIVLLAAFVVTVPSTYLGYPALGAANRLDLANRSVYVAGGVQALLLLGLVGAGAVMAIWVAVSVLVVEAVVCGLRAWWVRGVVMHPDARCEETPWRED